MAEETEKNKDTVFLQHPVEGDIQEVPEDLASEFESAGYVPAQLSDIVSRKRKEMLGGFVGQAGTALLSGLSGATLGASDVALTKSGAMMPDELREIREINPGSAMLGEVGGGIASMAYGGPLGMLAKGTTKLGAKAGAKAAQWAGKAPGGALDKIASAAVSESAIGAAIGAGQGMSQAAVMGDDIFTKKTGMQMLAGAGTGALFSGGLGVAGTGIKEGVKAIGSTVQSKMQFTGRLKELNGERKVLISQLDEAKMAGDTTKTLALENQLSELSTRIGARQSELSKDLFVRAAGIGTAMYLFGDNMGMAGIVGYLAAPTAMKSVERALTPISGYIPKDLIKKILPAQKPYRNPEIMAQGGGKYAYGVVETAESALGQMKDLTKRKFANMSKAAYGAAKEAKKITSEFQRINGKGATMPLEYARLGAMADDLKGLIYRAQNNIKNTKGVVDDQIRWTLKKSMSGPAGKFPTEVGNFQRNSDDYAKMLAETRGGYQSSMLELKSFKAEADELMQRVADQGGTYARRAQNEYRKLGQISDGLLQRSAEISGELTEQVISAVKGTSKLTSGPPTLLDKLQTLPFDKIQNAITKKIVPSAKAGATIKLTDTILEDMVRQAESLERDQLAMNIAAEIPKASPELVNSVTDRVSTALEYAKAQLPEQESKSAIERKRALARIRAVAQPETVLEAFADGTMTVAQRDALKAVYPESFAALQAIVRTETERAKATGEKYTQKQRSQIGMLLEDKKMYDPERIKQIQSVHQKGNEEKMQTRRGRLNLSKDYMTPMQRIKGGR